MKKEKSPGENSLRENSLREDKRREARRITPGRADRRESERPQERTRGERWTKRTRPSRRMLRIWPEQAELWKRPAPQRLGDFILECAVLLFLAWFFYRSFWAIPLMLPILPFLDRMLYGHHREQYQRELALQFSEAMGSLLTALRAGLSAEHAFGEAEKELRFLYGRDSYMGRELAGIRQGLAAGRTLEALLTEMGERSGIEEVHEFSQVFIIARRSGKNLSEAIASTIALLKEKIATEQEIRTALSARRLEIRIMDLAPFVITGYIGLTSPGFLDPLYHRPFGIGVMTLCLVGYLAAFYLGERMADIRV